MTYVYQFKLVNKFKAHVQIMPGEQCYFGIYICSNISYNKENQGAEKIHFLTDQLWKVKHAIIHT